MQKLGNKTKWALIIFGGMVLALNGFETALFGANYISGAFGTYDDPLARMVAAVYVVLMLDIAFLIWFSVFLGGEQSTEQRDVALVLSIMALVGSIAATVTQLSMGTELAPSLVPYRPTIGTIAFVLVVGITVGHIIGLAAHKYFDPQQRVKTETAVIQGEVYDTVFTELKGRMQQDADVLVDVLASQYRKVILHSLGFRSDLKLLGKEQNDPLVIPGTAVSTQPKITTEREGADGRSRILSESEIPDGLVMKYSIPINETSVAEIEKMAEECDGYAMCDLDEGVWIIFALPTPESSQPQAAYAGKATIAQDEGRSPNGNFSEA